MTLSDPRTALEAIGQLAEDEIDLADAAFHLARVDTPPADWAAAREHLSVLAREAATIDVAPNDLLGQAEALAILLAEKHGYRGDSETYEDRINANLIRVIERRRGLPVALGIIWLHAARAAGWLGHGLDVPGHFLIALGVVDRRLALDPFAGGGPLDDDDLRRLLKRTAGPREEPRPHLLLPMSDRAILLRLQNNILVRRLRAGEISGAIACAEDMRRIAPAHRGVARPPELIHRTPSDSPERSMALRVAVQMDPIETISLDGDSSFALMLAAQSRGHSLWHYEVRHLTLDLSPAGARLTALAQPVTVQRVRGDHYRFGPTETLDLATMDVVLMRQDPPFDMGYITATHMLEHIHPATLVVNDPASVRNAPEKLLVTHFPDLMPPTLVTWDPAAIRAFRALHRDIVVKPLFGNGGAGVFLIRHDDPNLASLLEMHFARSREPLMVQRYEAAVRRGDKRIILIDGEPLGAINRVPAEGEARSNMHVGGRPEHVELTARDREICARIGPTLRDQGLIFVGIDVIGDYLTEINVTSPTGLQEVARFSGVDLAAEIWNVIEAKRAA